MFPFKHSFRFLGSKKPKEAGNSSETGKKSPNSFICEETTVRKPVIIQDIKTNYNTQNRIKTKPAVQASPAVNIGQLATTTLPVPQNDLPSSAEKKRQFLKWAGVAGLGVVAAGILTPNKAQALVFGSTPASNVVGVKDSNNARINPAKEDGNLASIKTNTDPLITAGGGGYVRQDSTATIAKESGGNLATIAGKDFATQTTLATLATEESVILLRRIAKLADSLGVIDSAQRQRTVVDAGTITTVTTVTTVTSATNLVALGGVDGRYLYIDTAHNAYANAIRPNLIFS